MNIFSIICNLIHMINIIFKLIFFIILLNLAEINKIVIRLAQPWGMENFLEKVTTSGPVFWDSLDR